MKVLLRKLLGLESLWVFDSWGRVGFDFANYSSLRNSGLSHKQAIRELDRLWDSNTGKGLDE